MSLFFEAISQIAQLFTGSNSNNCIGQVQNTYLQEIIASCPNFQHLPILQTKEIQQFQTSVNTAPHLVTTPRRENSTFTYYSNLSPQLYEILVSFLENFELKIPLFDRRSNQDIQFIISKLKTISEINPKKLIHTGNKENQNIYNFSHADNSPFPHPESETISRIALASFLSFIHSVYTYKSKIQKKSPSKPDEDKNEDESKNPYFFDISVYSILFNLIILSIQLKPLKGQLLDPLKSALMILLEIFISESFKRYNIVYPPPKKILQRISTTPTIDEVNSISPPKEEEAEINIPKEKVTFDKDEFCLILNNVLSCFTSNLSLFFPGLDALLVGIEKHISSDHRSEMHFFDKTIIHFITKLASSTRPSTFSVESTRSLILLASNQLLKFDKDSLDFFIALSKHNDDASNTQIVMMLVNSLTIELPKERITNADNEIVKLSPKINKDRSKVKSEIDFDLASLFPKNEYFNECFTRPDMKYVIDLIVNNYLYASDEDSSTSTSFAPYIQEGYSKLVSKRIYKIIGILSESFRKSNVMLDKLYTTFGKAISNSSSLFDSLCLFVVFYLESKSKWHFEPSTNPSSFLLIQYLFSRKILTKRGTIVQKLQMYAIGILIDNNETYLLNILSDISKSYKINIKNVDENDINNLPVSPLFVLQILESLIVNYKKLVILLTNTSDSVLEPLSSIMNEMKKISFDEDYVSYFCVTYQDIDNNKNESKNVFKRDIDRVRYTFLILVGLIFENNEAKKILIDNVSFTRTFIDFVFEGSKVKEYILSQLENALMTSKCDPSIAFIPSIINIFESICSHDKKDVTFINKAFYITKDILSMINQTLSNRRDLCKNFKSFQPFIFQMISFIHDVNNNSIDSNVVLFQELIDFLARISIYLQINEQDNEIIRSTINTIWTSSSQLPKWLYYSLIKLMVPDEKLIRQPVLLHLIFDIFNNDEYLKFLCDTMDNNSFNVDKCCSVSFDKTIFKSLISDCSNFESQTLIKKLFTNIALISISPSVVYQYLRLLSPKDSFHLNENMSLYLNYLNELFVLSLETQHESWALNPEHSQKPVSFNLNSKATTMHKTSPKRSVNCYGDGYFTVVFWLKVEEMSPTYFPLIFSAKDENGNIYEVFIRGRKICINYDRIHHHASIPFHFTFDKDEWYFISLSFSKHEENDKKILLVTMIINNDQKYEVRLPITQMVTGNTTFVFGGVLHDHSIRSTNPCLLGPFALFDMLLRPDKLQSLYKQEQRFFCRDGKDPSRIHVYQPYADGPRQMQRSFASTIVLNVKMEVFIPLFLLIPMKFEDGSTYPNYVGTVIDIIKHGLNFGSIVEDSFCNANGFGIISFILSQSKYNKYCDYNLYCQFYSLFENLMTEKLKTEMIKTILLNFDLWSKIEKSEEIVQIFDNWLNALFPHNLLIISKIFSFSSLLNLIVFNFCLIEDQHLIKFQYELPQLSKSFLSFCDSSDDELKTKANLTEIQRQTINDILFQILLFFSVQKFTFDDYVLLISYLGNSQSSDLIMNIKKLLLQMIILKPSPLESVFENKTALSKLHQIFINEPKMSSIDAIESAIEIIIFLHKASMINGNQFILNSYSSNISSTTSSIFTKFSFSSLKTVNFQTFSLIDHLYTIIQQIPRETFGKREFFNCLLNLTEKASPEIFPFACWSAFCIINDMSSDQCKENRKEMLFSIFNNLEPSHEYVTPHWSLIPILLVIKVNDKAFANKMINFLIDCCKGDEWVGIYFTISILCNVFHVNPVKFQRIFLLKILNEATEKKDSKTSIKEILIQITSSYIFYRNIEFDNISKFFNESPFKLTKQQAPKGASEANKQTTTNLNSFTFNSLTTICSFISQISNIDLSSLKTVSYFGLRFHKMSGKWIDRDIALLLLKYISDFRSNESIYCLQLILIYYILHQNEDQKFVVTTVKELDKPQQFTNPNNDNFNYSFIAFMINSTENSHLKRQDVLQVLIDLVCFQIEKIGLSDYCPLFKHRSDNFRVNGSQFFTIVSFLFDDREMYEYFFTNNSMFSKRIQDISIEILKLSNIKTILPAFISSLEQQQQIAFRPFFDISYSPMVDPLRIFEVSQMETIVRKINDMYMYKHLFKDLFEAITTRNAPLYSMNKFRRNGRPYHMKRDKTLVAQLIPLRMKTCWLLESHRDAIQAAKPKKDKELNTNAAASSHVSPVSLSKDDVPPISPATSDSLNKTEVPAFQSATTSSQESQAPLNKTEVPAFQSTTSSQEPQTPNKVDSLALSPATSDSLNKTEVPAFQSTTTSSQESQAPLNKTEVPAFQSTTSDSLNKTEVPAFQSTTSPSSSLNKDDVPALQPATSGPASVSSTASAASKHFAKVRSFSVSDSPHPSQSLPVKQGTRVRRISTMMKKRLMLSASSCFVRIDSDCVKKNSELVSIDKTEDVHLTVTSNELKLLKLKNFKLVCLSFTDIKHVTRTTYLHKPVSLQVITSTGSELFIILETHESREALYAFITSRPGVRCTSFLDQIERSTRLWLDEEMTNFEYLLHVNMAGGRSFQNSSQYPVFPFVLNNYSADKTQSDILNTPLFLSNPQIFRNLAKPTGCIDGQKLETLKKNQSVLRKIQPDNAFLFQTGPSNPQILYGEMARIEPFLSLYITLQGGFISDEMKSSLLSSIPSLWESVLHDVTDFRELSPDFYMISPEFLQKPSNDIEKLIGFGNVFLPKWIEPNRPSEFLYVHRKALEANNVRASLNYWIDFVFGVKQRCESNLYENSLYEDAWSGEKGQAEMRKQKKIQKKKTEITVKTVGCQNDAVTYVKELEALKRVLGQVPLRVFSKPHPQCTIVMQSPRRTVRASTTTEKPILIGDKDNTNSSINLNVKQIKKEQNGQTKDGDTTNTRKSSVGGHLLNRPNLKYNRCLRNSLVQFPFISQAQAEQSKVEDSLSNIRVAKRANSINEPPEEILIKKQQTKLQQVRDAFFDIHKIILRKNKLIYAAVLSATKKAIKIHSIDKFGNRYLFMIDVPSLDVIYTKSISGEFLNNQINSQKQNQQESNQNPQKVESILNSILSIAPFKDCLFIVTQDKSILLDSDGNISINGHAIDSEIINSNSPIAENPNDVLQKKRYLKVAYDSECLVAVGTDSLIDLFKSSSSRIKNETLKAAASNSIGKGIAYGISLVDPNDSLYSNSQSNTKSTTLNNSDNPIKLLGSSSFDVNQFHPMTQNSDQTNFFFTDTLVLLKRPKRSFNFFSEYEVTCMAVSSFLNSLAVASKDGTILLYSLNKGSTIIEISLPSPFVAQKIIFTKGLGLLVVDAIIAENENVNIGIDDVIHSIFVFTLNGELIRRRAIPCGKKGLVQMSSFLSKKGIDYIAIITDDNAIHICEAFLLNFENFKQPQQLEKMMNSNNSKHNNDNDSKNNLDSPLLTGSNYNESVLDDENSMIKSQLNIPFPSIFKFDDNLVYFDYKKKLSSLLYITAGGELGLIPINKLVIEEY